jgi:glutamate synthase domain-containing protein 2/glutamate synthase domain-containing protein 1/glutamate synthase domain-containing protein 3
MAAMRAGRVTSLKGAPVAPYWTDRAWRLPASDGLYDPGFEHDACGTGFIANLIGQPEHRVVALGLEALARLQHRGAVGADGASGDGAGVLIAPTLAWWRRQFGQQWADGQSIGFAMCFLDPERLEAAQALVVQSLARQGLDLLAWREVPTQAGVLGAIARSAMPAIFQALVARAEDAPQTPDFEQELRRAGLAIAPELARSDIKAYLCSLSSRTTVYKALLRGGALGEFYPDLRDPDLHSAVCVFHQRYSTNTWPVWPLAQPFGLIAHNGEFNTLPGNLRECIAQAQAVGTVFYPGPGSDSGAFDRTLTQHLVAGVSLGDALRVMMPEILRQPCHITALAHAPWDGPAAVCFSDGRVVGACLDRNGLRPLRYWRTQDQLMIVASEAGVISPDSLSVVERGQFKAGELWVFDTAEGRAVPVADAPGHVQVPIADAARGDVSDFGHAEAVLLTAQKAFGYGREDVERLLAPMAQTGDVPVGSMGDDTSIALLARHPRTLYHYFKQRFAQVTNPPIDALREAVMMNLDVAVAHADGFLGLSSPVLQEETLALIQARVSAHACLDATCDVMEQAAGFERRLADLADEAVRLARVGVRVLILSDRAIAPARVAIPALLATSCVDMALIEAGLRGKVGLIVAAGDVIEDHHLALLLGFGATAVLPHVALRTVAALAPGLGLNGVMAQRNYQRALEAGLKKIMAKMGIGTLRSYQGAALFDAVGLSGAFLGRYFRGLRSPIGGIGLAELVDDCLMRHVGAFDVSGDAVLADQGQFRYRVGGEPHHNSPAVFKAIQQQARASQLDRVRPVVAVEARAWVLRDGLNPCSTQPPVALEQVESAGAIARRFVASAMSLGALSREAHQVIAMAMNRLGARSNSGEGGEDAARFKPDANGDCANSTIKQVAAGRFGVTPHYLLSADEIEIKIAQGAKPGEGGQLPGFKVNAEIARLRRARVGTPLISPPPHHDIYSIEDLAQLIHDLKTLHPLARIAVKLVASPGIGTIAAGVVKAGADVIHISGHDGGTGASPLGSLRYAGLPWELGLAEVQQTLLMNGLRARVRLRVDGGLKTGKDVVIATLLGADEFGFGTPLLIAAGCVMARQCHQNNCPVGIATQDERLRARFKGTPENIVAYLMGVAEDVREQLGELGFESLEAAVGRTDSLRTTPIAHPRGPTLDLGPLLVRPAPMVHSVSPHTSDSNTLSARLLEDVAGALDGRRPFIEHYSIHNMDRAIGTAVAGVLTRRHGETGAPKPIHLHFQGVAGQSFGAFGVGGLHLYLVGEANDYVGKGLAGGLLVIRPDRQMEQPQAIVGNTVLYGATGGALYAAGCAGQRFAVRNAGAIAVIEGVGHHACEYMTGGTVLILGSVGANLAAGMTGGDLYVYDPEGSLAAALNPDSVVARRLDSGHELAVLTLLQTHVDLTGSAFASAILAQWDRCREQVLHVQPHLPREPMPVRAPEAGVVSVNS